MALSPDLFRVEDLDLDRLYANLSEYDQTIRIVEGQLERDDLHEWERAQFAGRLQSETDMRKLTEQLIEKKRASL